MTYFALQYEVVDGFLEKRAPFRDAHLRLVRAAHARGEIVMAGALGNPPAGALLVFQGASADAAEEFARQDPYVINGLVTEWQARPWNLAVGP